MSDLLQRARENRINAVKTLSTLNSDNIFAVDFKTTRFDDAATPLVLRKQSKTQRPSANIDRTIPDRRVAA